MKGKQKARDRRTRDEQARKNLWRTPKPEPAVNEPAVVPEKTRVAPRQEPAGLQEEETREFLAYLEKNTIRFPVKDEDEVPERKKRARGTSIQNLNLEEGMPSVEEAVRRMRVGLQGIRSGHGAMVRLIHGYGSTGKGGRIRVGIRKELEDMKRKRLIRAFVPGEDFGPCSEEARKIVDRYPEAARDPDYGRCNHGITIVLL